jgi:phospholipase/carboxylesterase
MVRIDPELVQWSRRAEDRAGTPLLVALHGVGSNEHDLASLAPHLPSSWTVASPRAPLPYGPGFSWYPLAQPGSPDPTHVDTAVEALLAWVDEVAVDHDRVALLGFSQGASIALQSLRHRPDGFAFAVALSGFVPPAIGADGIDDRDRAVAAVRPRVFVGHGDRDPVIPPSATARTSVWAAEHTDVTDLEYPGLAHGIAQQELADVVAFIEATTR